MVSAANTMHENNALTRSEVESIQYKVCMCMQQFKSSYIYIHVYQKKNGVGKSLSHNLGQKTLIYLFKGHSIF